MILFKLKVDGFTGGDDERTGGSRQTATIASLAPGAELLAGGAGGTDVPTYRPARRSYRRYITIVRYVT